MTSQNTKHGLTRRKFIQTTGVGAAAGIAACQRLPVQHAIPYLVPPEEIVPGEATWYASTCTACAANCGLMVKTREGRPVKLEGLSEHPRSRGGLCAVGQADLRALYDPDRQQRPRLGGQATSWAKLDEHVSGQLGQLADKKIAVLSGPVSGPTARATIQGFVDAHKAGGTWVEYDPHPEASTAIAEAYAALGHGDVLPSWDPTKAELLVVLGADPLGGGLDPSSFTKRWAEQRRRAIEPGRPGLRHVQIEGSLTTSGASADERWQATAAEREAIAYELAAVLGGGKLAKRPAVPGHLAPRVAALAEELKELKGRSLVVSGSDRFGEQLAVALLNAALDNDRTTVLPDQPRRVVGSRDEALLDLVAGLEAGDYAALFVLDADPVDQLPQGAALREAIAKLPLSVALTARPTATAAACGVVAAAHHGLEAWGDHQVTPDVATLSQPVVRPIFDTRHPLTSLLTWQGEKQTDYRLVLASQWRAAPSAPASDSTFQRWVAAGLLPADVATRRAPSRARPMAPDPDHASWGALRTAAAAAVAGPALEVDLLADVGRRDGSRGFIPWLKELPDPLSRVSWYPVARIAPARATELGVTDGDVLAITANGATVELAARVTPGQHPAVIGVPVGWGLTDGDADQASRNAYRLAGWADGRRATRGLPAEVSRTGRRIELPLMQTSMSHHRRPIVHQVASPTAHVPAGHHGPPLSLWEERAPSDTRWNLAIDLDACTGCSACVVSCQVENNIPVVGETDMRDHRDMYWMRIDRYFDGDEANPDVLFEPMMCQQCGHAPCETVCPVLATMHSHDGLNQQAYNRCVGTRYCANNCPYKTRRFNWFDKQPGNPLERLVLNPDVVMRMQGVMEKCTFCVQRIQETRIAHKNGDADFPAAQTACQQSCPADAISFGNALDSKSAVVERAHSPRAFRVLDDIGVDPSVTYLAQVRQRGEQEDHS